MIPYNIVNVNKGGGKPLYATVVQSSDFTADAVDKAQYSGGSGGKFVLTLPDAVDTLKYPIGMRVSVEAADYADYFTVVSSTGTQLVVTPEAKGTVAFSAKGTGTVKPVGPVPYVKKEGTPIKDSRNHIKAVQYSGTNYFIITTNGLDAKLIQAVATSGTVTVTVKWSLDGVNYSDFSPAISVAGADAGILVTLMHINCLLKVTVVPSAGGTYYVMED